MNIEEWDKMVKIVVGGALELAVIAAVCSKDKSDPIATGKGALKAIFGDVVDNWETKGTGMIATMETCIEMEKKEQEGL